MLDSENLDPIRGNCVKFKLTLLAICVALSLGALGASTPAEAATSKKQAAKHKEARRQRVGYQTLINQVLAEHVRKSVA